MPNELVREVAEPGAVFWESVVHPDNVELLEGDPDKTRTLPADKLKLLIKRERFLKAALNDYFEAAIRHYCQRQKDIKRGLKKLPVDERAAAQAALATIDERIARIRERMYKCRRQRRNPVTIRTPLEMRKALLILHKIDARITEHFTALDNEKLMARLREEMQMEVSYYWGQIQDRWTALQYREEYFIDGKRYFRRVSCEEAHFTEDNIQYKIYVSHIALGGSTIHHMPDGVRAWDLVKEETLRELEAACECPVTSPHVDEDAPFDKGAWVIVHRVGMRDGLFNYISLNAVLAKYNQALRPKFAVPIGVRAGRIVEYLRFAEVPHAIITGITGSGKTNLERVILAVLCQFYSPAEIRIVAADLKEGGDLNMFAGIPHLLGGGIIKEIDALESMTIKLHQLMRQRLKLLSETNTVNIDVYNRKVIAEQRMERILFVIDECASINAAARQQRSNIWDALKWIAMKARAVGIQLLLCTQQGGTEVIPKEITNNVSYSINGRQRTSSGAMQAMGNNRAKKLSDIPGRMEADTGKGIVRLQTPEATEDALKAAIEVAMNYPVRELLLPGDTEDDTAPVDAVVETVEGVTRQRIIQIALTDHNGVMSSEKLYEATGKVMPIRRIRELIRDIADGGEVVYHDVTYAVKPKGKGYQLVRKAEPTTETISTVVSSDVVLPVGLEEGEASV